MSSDETFGFMLRKPEPHVEVDGFEQAAVYVAPDFTTATYSAHDPRWATDAWLLSLPHRCDEWQIWDGSRVDVLAAAYRFRAELDAAIAAMEAADD